MNDAVRPPTMKPTPDEYRRMAQAIEADFNTFAVPPQTGQTMLLELLTSVLPVEVVYKLLAKEDPDYDISKADTAKIVRKLQELVPGDRAADILWVVSIAERSFETQERAEQFIEFAMQRVKEFEDKEAEGVAKEPIDITKVSQLNKNRVDYSRMVMEDRLDFGNLDGKFARFRFDLPGYFWGGGPMGGLARVHIFWLEGDVVYGGHFEWMRVGGQTTKEIKNIVDNYMGRVPPNGATVYFCIISSDAKRRTDVVESKTKWKG